MFKVSIYRYESFQEDIGTVETFEDAISDITSWAKKNFYNSDEPIPYIRYWEENGETLVDFGSYARFGHIKELSEEETKAINEAKIASEDIKQRGTDATTISWEDFKKEINLPDPEYYKVDKDTLIDLVADSLRLDALIKNNVDEWGYYDVAQCRYLHGIYLSRQKSKQNIDFKDFAYEDVAEEDIDKGVYGEKLN